MQTYEILVKNRAVRGNSADMTLVRTSIGIDQVHILFDDAEWLDFPITITFAQGSDVVTQNLVVSEIDGSPDWVAEATVLIPHEVIDMNGKIRVTLQGTDSEGRHIITAKGAPLSVEEAGDVVLGAEPAESPTVDEWTQAYSLAMQAANGASGIVANLEARLEAIVEEARERLARVVSESYVPATYSSLGVVRVGSGLTVNEYGLLAADSTNGITLTQANNLDHVTQIAGKCFDVTYDSENEVDTAMLKGEAIPVDGTTIAVVDGKICLNIADGDGVVY